MATVALGGSLVFAQDGERVPSPSIGPDNTSPLPRIITATGTLSGRVTTSNGTPIRSAEVSLRSGDGRDSRIAVTDGGGQYQIRDLTPGPWSIWVSKSGFVTGSVTMADRSGVLNIANGQKLSRDVVLARAGAIAGRVVDDGGDPVADIQVQAIQRRSSSDASLTTIGVADTTDDTGAFRLYAIPPGTYYLRAVTNAGDRSPVFVNNANGVYYPGTPDLQNAEAITVTAGQEQLGFTLALPAVVTGVRVTGSLLTAAGTPAGDDASIHLTRAVGPRSGKDLGLLGQISNGRFVISNVPPGDYQIDALGALTRPESWERALTPLTVGTSPINDITVTMTPTRTVRGTVAVDSGTTPPRSFPGLSVVLETPSSALGSDSIAVPALGSFSLRGIWGLHYVALSGLPQGWMVKRIEIGGHELGAGLFDFSTVPATAALHITITDRVGELSGTVTDGNEGRRGVVVVFPDDETMWQYPTRYIIMAPSNDAGTFRIRGLGEMSYRAVAVSRAEADEIFDPVFLSEMKRVSGSFTLREGEKKTLNLALIQR